MNKLRLANPVGVLIIVLFILSSTILASCTTEIAPDTSPDPLALPAQEPTPAYRIALPYVRMDRGDDPAPTQEEQAESQQDGDGLQDNLPDNQEIPPPEEASPPVDAELVARLAGAEEDADLARSTVAALLANQAQRVAAESPDLALLLGVEAVSIDLAGGTAHSSVAEERLRVLLADGDHVLLPIPKPDSGTVDALRFSPDGRWLAGGSADGAIYLWNLESLQDAPVVLAGHTDQITTLAFTPDSNRLASASRDQTVLLWEVANLDAEPQLLSGHADWINALAISPDGRWLASVSDDATVRLWRLGEVATGPIVLPGHENWVRTLDIASDSQSLATGSHDNTVRLWDLTRMTERADRVPILVRAHDGWVNGVRFSPDGAFLATVSEDGKTRLWNLTKRGPATVLQESDVPLVALDFSPDGRWLATGDASFGVSFWERTQHGSERIEPDGSGPNVNGSDVEPFALPVSLAPDVGVYQLAFSPDSQRLAAVQADQTVRLWQMGDPSGGAVTFSFPDEAVTAMTFGPVGQWLATAASESGVGLWSLQIDDLIEMACNQAGRNLTWDEWQFYLPGQEYRPTCPQYPADLSGAQSYLQQGYSLARRGEQEQAMSHFQRAVEIDPTLEMEQIMSRQEQMRAEALLPRTHPNAKFGIDPLHPIDIHTGALSPTVADPNIIANTGAAWVRLNFVLGPWSGVNGTDRYHGRTWSETYRTIIDNYRRKGIKVYALISYESMKSDPGDDFRAAPPPDATSAPWIDTYVTTLMEILQLYGDDIEVMETLNEPDDWHDGSTNWIHPGWFAILQQRVYHAVKADPAFDPITVVSGPLQGLASNQNSAAGYLQRFYREGKNRFGWGENDIPFPFDGVGYHLYIWNRYYVDDIQQEAAIQDVYHLYVGQIHDIIRAQEGRDTPIYLSEIGWNSIGGNEELQADNLRVSLSMMADDPLVALGIWFAIQDFDAKTWEHAYGLYRQGDLVPTNRKPAFAAYKSAMHGDWLK